MRKLGRATLTLESEWSLEMKARCFAAKAAMPGSTELFEIAV
jgi:hypothetical protein